MDEAPPPTSVHVSTDVMVKSTLERKPRQCHDCCPHEHNPDGEHSLHSSPDGGKGSTHRVDQDTKNECHSIGKYQSLPTFLLRDKPCREKMV